MALYGAAEEEPMDDMPMGSDPSAAAGPYEPKDDEERAALEAFPELDENRMAALKEFVRLCVEKQMGGGYDKGGGSSPKPKGDGPDLAILFGEPKKKR